MLGCKLEQLLSLSCIIGQDCSELSSVLLSTARCSAAQSLQHSFSGMLAKAMQIDRRVHRKLLRRHAAYSH